MPKTEIDYSNTIIYKITCKDPSVTDVYVGHTTNFVQRKHAHKQSCINDKTPNYKCKLYEVIRNNGGWVNWKMEIINFFECHDHYEARKKEQEYFISLNATLNSIEPMPKPKPKEIVIKKEVVKETFFCEKCNIYCINLSLLEKHNETKKHKKENKMEKTKSAFSAKSAKIYNCDICNIECSKKNDYDRHILTNKHKSNETGNKEPANTIFTCGNCNKEYKSRKGLWGHKKTCIKIINEPQINNIELKIIDDKNDIEVVSDSSNNDIIKLLLKENSDFKNMLIDMMKSTTDLVKNNTDLQKQNQDIQKQMLEVCKNIQR